MSTNRKRSLVLITAGILIFLTGETLQVSAATSTKSLEGAVPEFPAESLDLFKSLKKIELGSDKVKAVTNSSSTVQNIGGQIRNGWNRLNNWFESTIGVSLRGILRALGYIIVWILLLLIRIINWLLSLI
jgi:hypothetical protein